MKQTPSLQRNLFPSKLISVFPELYAVGGCVRDFYLGVAPKDIDYASKLSPSEVLSRANSAGFHSIPTGMKHGTVTVIVDGVSYEITTFRKDLFCDGRAAIVEYFVSLEDDLDRRDFTINAMALSPSMELFCVEGAEEDLKNKIIKCVGNPFERFKEDYLRIIRMARFAARLGFSIDPATLEAAKSLSPKIIDHVSPERIFMEFNKAFEHDNSGQFLRILNEIGLFTLIFPEYEGFEDAKQDPVHHPEGAVSEHVYQVVDRASPKYKWHALLHDVGKVKVLKEFGCYHGHDAVGTDLIDSIADRLKFPNDLRESTKNTAKYHMYPIMMMSNGYTLRAHRRFHAKVLPFIEALKDVVMADKGERFEEVEKMFEELPESTITKPVLLGRHLLERGISPSPEMGKMLAKAFKYQIDEGVYDVEELIKMLGLCSPH